jgi:hypothetical protein
MKSFIVVIILFITSLPWVSAQSVSDSTSITSKIAANLRYGYVPTHGDGYLRGDNPSGNTLNSVGFAHLQYMFQFNRNSRLGRLYPTAYQGIGVGYTHYFQSGAETTVDGFKYTSYRSKESLLGSPILLYVLQGARIASLSRRLSLDYQWNFGASFGWNCYDYDKNPDNNVIGTKTNAYINLGFILNYELSPRVRLTAGLDLTHFSNGNTGHPNAGVNNIGGRIGMIYTLGKLKADDFQLPELQIDHYINYDLIVYGASRRKGYIDDTEATMIPGHFGIIGLNFNPMYNFNKYFRAGASLDFQYDESANIHDYRVPGTYGDNIKFYRPSFREQFAAGISVRGELVMPIFSINVGIGRNLLYKGADTKGWYQILALKTSLTKSIFLHVGYQLSHFEDPNNLMLGVGYRFNAH